jgi:TonB family protein
MTRTNNPANEKERPFLQKGNLRFGAGLFCLILLLHVFFVILSGFLPKKKPREVAPKQELLLAFEQVFTAPPPPPPPVLPKVREVLPERIPDPVEVNQEEPIDAFEDDAPDADAIDAGNFVDAGDYSGSPVPVAYAGPRRMSETEYLVMIMNRLEANRVYPLAMRKRGMQGDMAVDFTIHPDGSLGTIAIGDPKAHPFMKQATLETVKASAPFPVWEGTKEDYSMKVIIRYRLED